MLMEYIDNNYSKSEPIFISELPCTSKEALRHEMKKLTDEGKLIRVYNGVYYKPYKTILGTDGKFSINMYIEKKLLRSHEKVSGFIAGIGLYNKYGFTTQIPSVIEVVSNAASTKQRKILVDDYKIIIYKPLSIITDENINELEFLTLMTDIDKYSELNGNNLKIKLKEYVLKKNINFNLVKKLILLFPDKVFKNMYNGGLINELV